MSYGGEIPDATRSLSMSLMFDFPPIFKFLLKIIQDLNLRMEEGTVVLGAAEGSVQVSIRWDQGTETHQPLVVDSLILLQVQMVKIPIRR